MLDFKDTAKQIKACSCALCGEKLTAPIMYMGKMYGWSCIKKVSPTAKKPAKNSQLWQPCDLVSIEQLEGGEKITVLYMGFKFNGFTYVRNGIKICDTIIDNNGQYFINVKKYNKATNLYYSNK